jgi:ferredoxin-type protein NapG
VTAPDPSRRAFFGKLLKRGARAATEQVAQRLPVLPTRRRPPGAVGPMAFLERCTKCLDCVTACPHHAIFTLAAGATDEGTPVMMPDQRACEMCEGFPCAAACEPNALVVPEQTTVALGKVRIREDLCFTFRGPECGACAGWCPSDVDALAMRLNKPRVDEETCIGCGLCITACPTSPKAIELVPLSGAP